MLFWIINTISILITAIVIYIFWIRPLLKQTPTFKSLYEENGSFWSAIRLKLQGLKQKLTAAFLIFASLTVELYDHILPAMTGVDITPLTSKVPQWLWPIIAISGVALLNYFRSLSDKRNEKK